MVSNVETSKESATKLLVPITNYNKLAGYKVNIQNSIPYVYKIKN
jgi:hypothetical protein